MIYGLLESDPLSLTSYFLLLIAIISLWFKNHIRVWGILASLSLLCGVLADRLELWGLIGIILLGACYYFMDKGNANLMIRRLSTALAIILSVLLMAHLLPGFNNWKIIDNHSLSQLSTPFSMYLSLDKGFVGLFILGLGFPLIKNRGEWFAILPATFIILSIALVLVIGLSSLMGYTAWDIKYPDVLLIWMLKNLFFTCVAEEAFFRGVLQKKLEETLSGYTYGDMISLLSVSILFGLVHFGGGLHYIILATIAGVAYGYVYQKTQRIEAAVLCHFGVNLFHIVFLTYPALR